MDRDRELCTKAAPCPLLETVVWHDLFLGQPRSRRYPKFKFNIRRDIPGRGVGGVFLPVDTRSSFLWTTAIFSQPADLD